MGAGIVQRPPAKELKNVLDEHRTFNMHKGDTAALAPQHHKLKIGLGWTTRPKGGADSKGEANGKAKGGDTAPVAEACRTCGRVCDSRNALFAHLRESACGKGLSLPPKVVAARDHTKGGGAQIDLDASVVLLGRAADGGYRPVLDTVWHNDTQAPGIVHSGDNRTGEGDGDDETIEVDLDRLAAGTERLVVVINAHSGTFGDVECAHARVFIPQRGPRKGGPPKEVELARYDLEATASQSVVLCAFEKRSDGGWAFEAIGKQCGGRTAKASECVDAVRGRPFRPVPELQQGQSIFLDPALYDDAEDRLYILDEWGCRGGWLWLDATLLLFDKGGRKLGEVDFNDKSWPARNPCITHSGDRKDESGKFGSHEIAVQMQKLTQQHSNVFSLLLVISAYTKNLTHAVKPLVVLRDSEQAEIARYAPDTNYNATSIQMVDMHRAGAGWMLTAHGVLGRGKANAYEPIIKAYKGLLKQIVDQQAAGGSQRVPATLKVPPAMDYNSAVKENFKPGKPVT